jgi:hypothetical protein
MIFSLTLRFFYEYPSEHLDSLHQDDYQPPLCSCLNTSKDLLCLKEDPCDDSPQPLPITILCCVARVVVGKYVFDFEFPLGKTLESKGWLNISILSVSSQLFNYPLRIFQLSNTSLSIPSQTSQYENVLGSQCAELLSQCSETWNFIDPFLKWFEYFPQRWNW